jgi:single-strand DNA-binding protein
MGASLNECCFIGNLGADPEIRQAGDKQVANWNIACSETWGQGDNKQQRTEWIPCVAWGALAGIAQQYLRKGSQVWVRGRFATRSWEDKEGQKRYKTEIVVERLQMLGSRDNGGHERAQGGGQQGGNSYGGGGGFYQAPPDDLPF